VAGGRPSVTSAEDQACAGGYGAGLDWEQTLPKSVAAALLLFVVLSLVFTYPLPLHLADAVEDRQDALLNVWITAWDGHQLLQDPLHLFDANIFDPYPRTLAYSELLLGNGLLALPITAATGNPLLGYNVALLLSFVLSGLGAYLLALRLSRSQGAGLVAGVIFAFSAYRMTNLAQAQLLITQWLPFALLALIFLIRQPSLRRAIVFVLFFCLQALSSFYYAILLALTVLGYVLWAWVARRSADALHRSSAGYLLLAALLCALIILPFAWPYFQVQRELGFERSLADSEPFSASLGQYGLVPPGSVLSGLWLPSDDTPLAGGYPVDALFPGLVTLALAAWGLIRGRGSLRWFFFLLLMVAFALSLGPRLYLAPGRPVSLSASLPYAWLYAVVPGFKALRAPARFDVLVTLALAVLASYGVASLERAVRHSGRKFSGVALLLTALVLLESWVWPAARAEPVPVGEQVPPVIRWLAEQPPGSILELPLAFAPGGPQLEYQYLSTYHWQTTPDGYSGFIPPRHGQIVYEMERFPSERSLSLLQALGVRYAIVHAQRYAPRRWQEMEAALAGVGELRLVETFGSDRVYEVEPRAFDARVLNVSGYLPPRAVVGQSYIAYVIAVNRGKRSYALRPTDPVQATAVWEAAGETLAADVSADAPLVTSPAGGAAVIPLSLEAPEKPGAWRLRIKEREGVLGDWLLEGMVKVDAQGDADFPVPVRLERWDLPPRVRPGDALPVKLAWRALGKIDAYYSVYVKLLDAQGNAVVGWDGQPRNGEAPTLLWVPGEAIEDTVVLTVPADAPPGEYTVEVGMYRARDLARCLTLDQDGVPLGSVNLGTVRVRP